MKRFIARFVSYLSKNIGNKEDTPKLIYPPRIDGQFVGEEKDIMVFLSRAKEILLFYPEVESSKLLKIGFIKVTDNHFRIQLNQSNVDLASIFSLAKVGFTSLQLIDSKGVIFAEFNDDFNDVTVKI